MTDNSFSKLNEFYVQMFGFLLYATEFASEDNGDGGILSISKVKLSHKSNTYYLKGH